MSVPSWKFLDFFSVRTVARGVPTWDAAGVLIGRASEVAEKRRADLEEALSRSDALLLEFGGDPARRDWTRFRPLRVTREEDWSDWLAHLIECSTSGRFLESLVGLRVPDATRVRAEREDVLADVARRADVVVLAGASGVTIEVKIEDDDYEKTWETADGIHRKYPQVERWSDFILMPRDLLPAWERVQPALGIEVRTLTWERLASSLRREAGGRTESAEWRAWALAFCGSIEQQLLGLPHVQRDSRLTLLAVERRLELLEEK